MRLICMVALVCIQGLIPLCAQKDVLFQFAGTTEEVSARVLGSNNATSNYGQILTGRGLRLTLTADEERTTLSFSKGITAFSIAALNRISGTKPNSQDVGCLIRGYTLEGDEATPYHFFDTYDSHQPRFLTLEVLSKRPILFFPEEIFKLSITPVNLGSKDIIQFTIDGLSKSSFDYGYFSEDYDYCSLAEIFVVFDYSGSVSDSELADYKRYAWNQLSAFADKGLALRILKYDEDTETEYYVERLCSDELVVGTELHHNFFKPPHGRQRTAGLTNLQSVINYVSKQKKNSKVVLIYTDDIPNLSSLNESKLSAIEGMENMLNTIHGLQSPVWIITFNKQLLGLSGFLDKNMGKPFCIPLDEQNYFDSALSCLNKNEERGDITAFPNPSNGNFTIRCSNYEEHHYSSIQLRDASGKKVFQNIILNGEHTNIETINLSAGNYFLWVVGNNGGTEIIPITIAK